jgi:hypothetical protein
MPVLVVYAVLLEPILEGPAGKAQLLGGTPPVTFVIFQRSEDSFPLQVPQGSGALLSDREAL